MKKGYIIAGGLLLVFLLLQFFQPQKNMGQEGVEEDMLICLSAPEELAALLQNSCYDCHSNHTAYPFYSRISPLSWYLHKHIEEGKEALYFSEFGEKGRAGKIGALADICEVVEAGIMPLQSYILVHRDAALSGEQAGLICTWAEAESQKLLHPQEE